jgi:drug/metabolite transporter (DMT)-like permease
MYLQSSKIDMRDSANTAAVGRAIVGAAIIATSALLVAQAGTTVATSAAARCLFAFPLLLALALIRRSGPVASTSVVWACAAGAFFAADLLLWHTAIAAVGTGLATVLANCQVAIVGLVAWGLLKEVPTRGQLAAVPIVLGGIIAISGVVGGTSFGSAPVLGAVTGAATGIAYSGFLLSMRMATPPQEHPAVALAVATLVSGLLCLLVGMASPSLVGEIEWGLSAGQLSWLLALAVGSQVVAWLLITEAFKLLPAIVVSLVLTLQPVVSLLLGAVLLHERPGPTQWLGALLVLGGMVTAALWTSPIRKPRVLPDTPQS